MNINTLTDLYRHMEWADAAVWVAVLASEGGRVDAKLRESLYHLHVVQRAFLRAWRGEPRGAGTGEAFAAGKVSEGEQLHQSQERV